MNLKNIFGLSHENIKLETLVNIRWIAVIGQLFAVCVINFYFKFSFLFIPCLVVIFCSIFINLYVEFFHKKIQRLNNFWATVSILYDLIQLAVLLFLTGGLQNPFSILIIVPTTIAVTFLSKRSSFSISIISIILVSILANFHYPLPGPNIAIPQYYLIGLWASLTVGIIFLGSYAYLISAEVKKRSSAFDKLEKSLSKEQELKSLGGLAAAAAHEFGTPLGTIALVAKELKKQLGKNKKYKNDIELLSSQIERCKNILKDLSVDPNKKDTFIENITIKNLINEIVYSFDMPKKKSIQVDNHKITNNIKISKKIEIVYALRNLVDNAIKFCSSLVKIEIFNLNRKIYLNISDDGKGFPQDIIQNLGDPYIRSSLISKNKSGLGLGIFISKTLLERTNAKVSFKQNTELGGALINIVWKESDLISN